MKRTLVIVISAIIAITSLSACGKNTSTDTGDKIGSVDNGKHIGLQKYAEPITLTTFRSSSDSLERDLAMTEDGETVENNRYNKFYSEELNINLDYLWIAKGDAYEVKLNLAISSGEIPDVFLVSATQAKQLYKAGKIQSLTQIYDKYATESTKSYISSDPAGENIFKTVTFDGELYGIPKMWSSYDSAQFLWVREDWLKKYNLPEPTTMENVITIATRFSQEDPDGNGKKDTIGIGFQSALNGNIGGMTGFFNGYHAYLDCFFKDNNGKFYYSYFTPEMKNALTALADLYKKGAISSEYSTTDQSRIQELIVAGKIGMFYGEHWMPLTPLQDAMAIDNNAQWKAYAIPSADSTPASTQLTAGTNSWWVVSKNCKYPEAIVKIVNLQYDDSRELPEYLTKMDVANYYSFNPFLIQDPLVNIKQMEGLKNYKSGKEVDRNKSGIGEKIDQYEAFKKGNENYWYVDQIYGVEGCPIETLKNVYLDKKLTVVSQFEGGTSDTLVKKSSTLYKLITQSFVEIITGSKDVKELDALEKRWLSLGGQDILNEINS